MVLRALAVGLTAAVVTVTLALSGVLETVELGALDRLFELRGPRATQAPIVIVTIDENTFEELNLPWPFPRALHGELIDALAAGRPLAIGLDILFPEPSVHGPGDDEALGAAVARAGNVVLGSAITVAAESFYVRTDLNPPQPVIRQGAAGVGPVNLDTDRDGYLRRATLRRVVGAEVLEAWDLHLYRLARAGGLPAAPLPDGDELLINYRGGPNTFPWVPYHRVVNGDVNPEEFRGRIVLVGATSPVLQDIYSTPFATSRAMPGVEVHAHILDTLIRGDRLRPVPAAASTVLAALLALVAAALVAHLRALRALAAVALLAVLVAGGTVALFVVASVWFQAVGVMLALVLGYGATVLDGYVREQRERRRLSQFFSPAVLREVVRHRDDAALASTRRVITVLFSDIRGFTSLSERIEPEQVAAMLHEYLTEMTDVVFRHGGTVDKYVGDCIMALYNAPFDDPDHAAHAIHTALELQERTLAVSARWEARMGGQIRNGVGINTGEAVVGTLGSRQRLEYTAIGDTVNLASRLEGLTKDYGRSIIVSESTHELVRGRFLTRQLGAVSVKGRARPVRIYAVLPADLRRYPRALLDAAATVVAIGGGERQVVRTRDVGPGGLAVLGLPAEWPVGAKVQIRLEGGQLAAPITAEGTVAWRDEEAAGIAFAEPDVAAVPAITEYVSRQRRP